MIALLVLLTIGAPPAEEKCTETACKLYRSAAIEFRKNARDRTLERDTCRENAAQDEEDHRKAAESFLRGAGAPPGSEGIPIEAGLLITGAALVIGLLGGVLLDHHVLPH